MSTSKPKNCPSCGAKDQEPCFGLKLGAIHADRVKGANMPNIGGNSVKFGNLSDRAKLLN